MEVVGTVVAEVRVVLNRKGYIQSHNRNKSWRHKNGSSGRWSLSNSKVGINGVEELVVVDEVRGSKVEVKTVVVE